VFLCCNYSFDVVNYSLTPWNRVLLQKLSRVTYTLYGTRKFITLWKRHRQIFAVLSHINPIHSPSLVKCIKYPFNDIVYLHLVLSNGLFPSGFPIKALYVFFFWTTNSTCPIHLTLLDLLTWIISCKKYQIYTAYWEGSWFNRGDAEFCTILSLPPSQAQTCFFSPQCVNF
jgi:hypothetical protein